MDTSRPCGCKGRRTCLMCEEEYGLNINSGKDLQQSRQADSGRFHSASIKHQLCCNNCLPDKVCFCTAPKDTHPEISSECQESTQSVQKSVSSLETACSPTERNYFSKENPRFESRNHHENSKFSSHVSANFKRHQMLQRFHKNVTLLSRTELPHIQRRKNSGISSTEIEDVVEGLVNREIYVGRKKHKSRPKSVIGLQTAPVLHPMRTSDKGRGQGMIHDCICIASSADIGAVSESDNAALCCRHVLTWASRIPQDTITLSSDASAHVNAHESGAKVNVVITTPLSVTHSSEHPASHTAKDYYHSMQGRPDEKNDCNCNSSNQKYHIQTSKDAESQYIVKDSRNGWDRSAEGEEGEITGDPNALNTREFLIDKHHEDYDNEGTPFSNIGNQHSERVNDMYDEGVEPHSSREPHSREVRSSPKLSENHSSRASREERYSSGHQRPTISEDHPVRASREERYSSGHQRPTISEDHSLRAPREERYSSGHQRPTILGNHSLRASREERYSSGHQRPTISEDSSIRASREERYNSGHQRPTISGNPSLRVPREERYGSGYQRPLTGVVIRRHGFKNSRPSLKEWRDPHKLYPDPLRWGGERPFRWEDNLRSVKTKTVKASHPREWMPVGRHQYTHHASYPFWPEAITKRPILLSKYLCEMTPSDCIQGTTQGLNFKSYVYCPTCQKAWPGWDMNLYLAHPNHDGEPISYPGIFIKLDWLSEKEEKQLIDGMDEMQWDNSQSGRRKQNFGPKCNFKKQKIRVGDFDGFPAFSKFVQDKFKTVPILQGFYTVEQCSLEYDPCRGASIDPHIDDCWVWGERIVTVNLLSDTVLTMTPYEGEQWRYNLPLISTYDPVLNSDGVLINNQIRAVIEGKILNVVDSENKIHIQGFGLVEKGVVVRIPMPRRSLLVIYGPPRYLWEHCVLRKDIRERRLCLAYREFTPLYLPGGKFSHEGSSVLSLSSNFWNHKDLTSHETDSHVIPV